MGSGIRQMRRHGLGYRIVAVGLVLLLLPIISSARPPERKDPRQSQGILCLQLRAEIAQLKSDIHLMDVAIAQIQVVLAAAEIARAAVSLQAVSLSSDDEDITEYVDEIQQLNNLRTVLSNIGLVIQSAEKAFGKSSTWKALAKIWPKAPLFARAAWRFVNPILKFLGLMKAAAIVWSWVTGDPADSIQANWMIAALRLDGQVRMALLDRYVPGASRQLREAVAQIRSLVNDFLDRDGKLVFDAENLRAKLARKLLEKERDLEYFISTGQCEEDEANCSAPGPRPVRLIEMVPTDLTQAERTLRNILLDQQNFDLTKPFDDFQHLPVEVPNSPFESPGSELLQSGSDAAPHSDTLQSVSDEVHRALGQGAGVVVLGSGQQVHLLNDLTHQFDDQQDTPLTFVAINPGAEPSDGVQSFGEPIAGLATPALGSIVGQQRPRPAVRSEGPDAGISPPTEPQPPTEIDAVTPSEMDLIAEFENRFLTDLENATQFEDLAQDPMGGGALDALGGVGSDPGLNGLFPAAPDSSDIRSGLSDALGRAECDDYRPPNRSASRAGTYGHPSLVTFDDVSFLFHGAGDYLLTESLDESLPLRVVVRFARLPGADMASVSYNRSLAIEVGETLITIGDTPPVGSDAQRPFDPALLTLDGRPLSSGSLERQTIAFAGGTIGVVANDGQSSYRISLDDGTEIKASTVISGPYTIELSARRAGLVRGLLGNADGVADDEPVAADGVVVDPSSHEELYEIFGRSWLVDSTPFLTTPAEAGSLEIIPPIPTPSAPQSLADLPEEVVQAAMAACREQGISAGQGLTQCAFDLAMTGDDRWIDTTRSVSGLAAGTLDSAVFQADPEDVEEITFPFRIDGNGPADGPGLLESGSGVELLRFEADSSAALHFGRCSQESAANEFTAYVVEPPDRVLAKVPLADCKPARVRLEAQGEYEVRIVDVAKRGGAYGLDLFLTEIGPRVDLDDSAFAGPTNPVTLGTSQMQSDWLLVGADGGLHSVVISPQGDGCDLEGVTVTISRANNGDVVSSTQTPRESCQALDSLLLDAGTDYLLTFAIDPAAAEGLRLREASLTKAGRVRAGALHFDFHVDQIEPERIPTTLDLGSDPVSLAGFAPHNKAPVAWSFAADKPTQLRVKLRPEWCAPAVGHELLRVTVQSQEHGDVRPQVIFGDGGRCDQSMLFDLRAGLHVLTVSSLGSARAGFNLEVSTDDQ